MSRPTSEELERQVAQLRQALSELENRQAAERRSVRLLDAIRRAQSLYITEADPADVYKLLLRTLVEITQSEYGFLDEVVHDADGAVYKKNLAISDLSWDEPSRRLYRQLQDRDLKFSYLDNLSGLPALTGETVIANDPATDSRSRGLPEGHPQIRSFLGMPLFFGGKLIGVAGVANRQAGYTVEIARFLEPLLSTCAAITDALRREAVERENERRLADSEARFRLLYERAPIGYQSLDAEGRFIEVNQAWLDTLGYRREDVIGRSFAEFLTPEWQDHFRQNFPRFKAVGEILGVEFEMIKKDGTVILVSFNGRIGKDREGNFQQTHCVLHDITQERKTQAALRESEERYRNLVENISDVIFEVDAQGVITYISPVGARIWGGRMSDVQGRNFIELVHPDDQPQLADRFAEIQQGIEKPMIYRFVDKSGRVLWGRSHSRAIWKDGRFAGVRGTLMDLTAQKEAEAEKERLQEKLAQARKMESVGRLAGGVAHDFNNMLGVILGHTEMAQEAMDPSHPICEDLEEIRKAAERSADLTRQLLAFARKQPIAPRVLDLNATVAGMLRMLQRLIGEDIRLAWSPGAGLWPLRMDPSQVDQILANLCVNARDAIDGGGTVAIETANETLDGAFCERNPGFAPGVYVRLTVRDDGRGMDEETLANLFEPFFTTKEVGQGTGLGLATIYGIVRQNDGFVTAQSEPGKGTAFHIYLPRHLPGAGVSPPAEAPAPPVRGHGTVLLVEDEPAILKMTATMLGRLGYDVLTAATPEEAVHQAEAHPGGIDLLMTDVVMPGMNGKELAARLQGCQPGLRRLFMSGYTADVIARHGMLEEGRHYIQKPFSRSELAASVRAALERGLGGLEGN